MAHFLGVTVELYNKIYWYDKFTHFLSGILTALAAIYILVKNKYAVIATNDGLMTGEVFNTTTMEEIELELTKENAHMIGYTKDALTNINIQSYEHFLL